LLFYAQILFFKRAVAVLSMYLEHLNPHKPRIAKNDANWVAISQAQSSFLYEG
jgi:hypothetical protein